MNTLINWLLFKVVKKSLDKLPLPGRATVFGLLVACIGYLAQYSPEGLAIYIDYITQILNELGASSIIGASLPDILENIGLFISGLGLTRKALNLNPQTGKIDYPG